MRLALVALLLFAGCNAAPTDATMGRLVQDLRQACPQQISRIEFVNSPPDDPAAIYIEYGPGMTLDEERRFICEQVKARVDAVDARILVVTDHTTSPRDCPDPGQ